MSKSNGTLYWYDVRGEVIEETDLTGNVQNDYVFLRGERVAKRDSSGAVYLYLKDVVGSTAMLTDANANVKNSSDFYPFGGERVITSTVANNYKFTGLERDSETGLDHTLFRQYPSSMGRWLTPDPICKGCTNPQKLNRYQYALNNPVTLTDPLGLFALNPGGEGGGSAVITCTVGGVEYSGVFCEVLYNDLLFRGGLGPYISNGDAKGPKLLFEEKYAKCSKEAFGNQNGHVDKGLNLSTAATLDILLASAATGEDPGTIAATYLIESGGGNLNPANHLNDNGSVDVGPMQLNSAFMGKDDWHPAGIAYGTNLGAGDIFNGNPYANILAGAGYLYHLDQIGRDPSWYVGGDADAQAKRDKRLGEILPKVDPFFDCLNSDQ